MIELIEHGDGRRDQKEDDHQRRMSLTRWFEQLV